MEIVRLAVGEAAPFDSDCIGLEPLADGKCSLTGSLLQGDESVAMLGGGPYASRELAEAAGLAWAAEHDVALLYVTTADGDGPPGPP